MPKVWQRQVAPFLWECTGTFALSYTIGTAGTHSTSATSQSSHDLPLVGLAIGTILAVFVYAGGPLSGGHFNPAVSLGCMMCGATPVVTGLGYMVCQLVGAALGGGFAVATRGADEALYPDLSPDFQRTGSAFLLELIFSFFLVYTVLNTAVAKQTQGNNYFGLAIGYSVFVGATCIGPYTGGAMNPAIGIGLDVTVHGHFQWIYLVAPMLGGVAAGMCHLVHHPPARQASTTDSFHVLREYLGSCYKKQWAQYQVEFLGTFYLSFTVALSVAGYANASVSEVAPLAIGASLMIAVYFGGHISGGHYNPAVTIGLALIGKFGGSTVLGYIVAQLAGAFMAGFVAWEVLDGVEMGGNKELHCGHPAVNDSLPVFRAVLAEAIFSFLLVTCVMFTATTKRNEGNHYFGFAIGMAVFVGSVSVGGVSGAAFNPAVGTALPLVCGKGEPVWVYWVGPMLGAVAAAMFYILTSPEDFSFRDREDDEDAAEDQRALGNASYNDSAGDPYREAPTMDDGVGYAAADG